MRRHRKSAAAIAVLASISLLAAACGDDDDDGGTETTDGGSTSEPTDTSAGGTEDTSTGDTGTEDTGGTAAGIAGGEFVDCGTFLEGPPADLDPALNAERDAAQVIQALYSGLTDTDYTDPENPVIVPDLAESYKSNKDATVWTFKLREGLTFASGEEITPTTFVNSWERAIKLKGDYSYLYTEFIKGAQELSDGKADALSGVKADDDTMTLTITLSKPYANFDAVIGFNVFVPVPEEAMESENYGTEAMIGSGPYTMEEPASRTSIKLVKNDSWAGTHDGDTKDDRLDTIELVVSADSASAYNSFKAGQCHDAHIDPATTQEAEEQFATTTNVKVSGIYHFLFDQRDWVGGDENKLFRQAVSQAIDRQDIVDTVYAGARTPATGETPPGIPGFQENMCDYCTYDPEAAQAALDEWKAAGNEQPGPLKVQFGTGQGEHEAVTDIVVNNLEAIGIDVERDPRPTETYFDALEAGDCIFCRAGWIMDYPIYDNFMFDLFHSSALDFNNYGFDNPDFDKLVEQAQSETDEKKRDDLFHQAEDLLLNDQIMVVPITFYSGDYVYNPETVATFPYTPGMDNVWEDIRLAE